MVYDYVIVGGGPSGLTLALYLSEIGKKCVLVDRHDNLGGCHRVIREGDEEMFTEHGPRVYSDTYSNVMTILEKIGTSWSDTFTKYNFNISDIQGYTFGRFSFREKALFGFEFIKLVFGLETSRTTSVGSFAENHNFSALSRDYINRICRLTDGAGSDRYSLFQFLQLMNQNFGHTLYQPRYPHDTHLFKLWKDVLIKNGVEFTTGNVISITDNVATLESGGILEGGKILVCIPPNAFVNLALSSTINNTPMHKIWDGIEEKARDSSYISDIPISFHWKKNQHVKKIWGFPRGDWGIAFIVLTNYMKPETDYEFGISSCITIGDVKSYYTKKTANESTEDELVMETFRQIRLAYPELEMYDKAIINPTVKYTGTEWMDEDSAYVRTFKNQTIPMSVKNQSEPVYYIGTHNGNSVYEFTSMESAVTNSLVALKELEPNLDIKIKSPIDLVTKIRITVLILLLLITVVLFFHLRKK